MQQLFGGLVTVDVDVTFARTSYLIEQIMDQLRSPNGTTLSDEWDARLTSIVETIDEEQPISEGDKQFLMGLYLVLSS
jgi:hypothetical protein